MLESTDCVGISSLPPSPRHTPPPPPESPTAILLRHATAGHLQEAHETLCRYMLTQTPDPTTGRLKLGLFCDSIKAAIANRHEALVSYLFSMGIGEPSLYVWEALEAKSTAIFQVFLDHGWDINKPLGRNKAPPLGYVSNDRALTEWFLNNDANPNATCDWDYTPMSNAMQCASLDTINLLFTHGADINHGQLLHNAVIREGPEEEVIKLVDLLLKKGALIDEIQYQNDPQTFGELEAFSLGTPLHYAAEMGKEMLVSHLLKNGANQHIKNSKGKTVIEVAPHLKFSDVE
ncbi:hypothetical protein VE03_01038 [Pseudogymnoascus sp. 23342-1-I1]|nr:hypothetical protein VE03_01038 [Pseudogymnoascus sp. 23342-1-I1]